MTMMRTTLIGFVLVFIGFPLSGDLLGYDALACFLIGSMLMLTCALAGAALVLWRAPTRARAIQGFSEWGYITYQEPRVSWWARLRAAWRRARGVGKLYTVATSEYLRRRNLL